MNRAIVTGSTGLVGKAVVTHLVNNGVEVLCLGRKKLNPSQVEEFFTKKVTYLSIEMSDINSLINKIDKSQWLSAADCVFYNFAWSGIQRLTDGSCEQQIKNAANAANALKVAKQLGCRKFINSGTMEETFAEQNIRYKKPKHVLNQFNYTIAKLASRDICRMVSYLEKIDYIHTRLSAPIRADFSEGNFIAKTLRAISQGKPYQKPLSKKLYDIISVDDVARAYFLIGKFGRNKADYFIGTAKPATLNNYFLNYEKFLGSLISNQKREHHAKQDISLFKISELTKDTGFIPIVDRRLIARKNSMKQAIVTGATGFIGSVFVELLVNEGVDVLALGRKPNSELSSFRREKLIGAKYVCIDMSSISNLRQEISILDWDVGESCVFFNLAWGGADRLSDLDVEAQLQNVNYSLEAMITASNLGCCRFVQIGTMEEAFTEKYLQLDHKIDTQYNRHVIYSVAKISAKQALLLKSQQLDIEFLYVLHSHVMGPGDDKDSFLQVTLKKLVEGQDLIFSSGEQYFDVISTHDCAFGYYLIGKKGRDKTEYWVGSGKPCRLKEYVERMHALFPSKKPMQFGKLPYNDVILSPDDFSIELLQKHTGYVPSKCYEEVVTDLYEHIFIKKQAGK